MVPIQVIARTPARPEAILDQGLPPVLDELVELAAALTDMPMALLTLVDAERQWHVAHTGMDGDWPLRQDGASDFVVSSKADLHVPDLSADERFCMRGPVAGEPVRFYAGTPLINAAGAAIGALSVLDVRPRQLRRTRRKLLARLGALATAHLELHIADTLLEERSQTLWTVSSRLEAFLEHAQAPIYIKDRRGTFIVANRALHNLLGLERGSMVDRTAHELLPAEIAAQLTGPPNRAMLMDGLDQALARSRRNASFVAVLFMDLDDFKVVNDSLGHAAGYELLQEVARRVRSELRDTDIAARLGGDEFVVICDGLSSASDVELVTARLTSGLHGVAEIRDQMVALSVSIGVAVSSPEATASSLLRDADAAMYRAKHRGKARYEIADVHLQARASRQLSLQAGLRLALERGEFRLYYQPCVDLVSDQLVGVEALLRWQHPQHGLLAPAAFLDVAEERELIADIGSWVIDAACRQTSLWHKKFGDAVPTVWISVAARQLGRHELARSLEAALNSYHLPSGSLGVEPTERQVIRAAHSVRADLNALPALGVPIAVDDFGTGHNGMEYLRELPIDTLKIDKSFIRGLGTDRTTTALATSMIALGRSLELTVVAEGVETLGQLELLKALGCDRAQGFLLGLPDEAAHLDRWMDLRGQQSRRP